MLQELVFAVPHQALRAEVRGYCGYREHSVGALRRREVPHGQVTLIVSFGAPISLAHSGTAFTHQSFLAGLHDEHVVTEFAGWQHGMQIDLTPLGAYRLLGSTMRDLANTSAGLDALEHPGLTCLAEQLAEAPGWPERFALLDGLLLGWWQDGLSADPEVAWVWRQLARSGGNVPIGELADEVGWSRRHLAVRFREQVGLAPKPTARVLRFRRAAALLRRPGSVAISDVAATCGYADHAHLAREFGELAGCTPTELRAGK